MQIDPTKSALQNFLNLVDAQNANGPSNPSQVTFSNIQAATSGSDPAANTSVELSGVSGQGFTGNQTYFYGRLALSVEAANPTGSVQIPAGTTDPAAVLALVATFYGFIPSEISWVSAPAVNDATAQVQSSGSLVYLDGTATVNLTWLS